MYMRPTMMACFLLLAIQLLAEFGCSDAISPPYKSPRDYTWTADTFYYPYILQTMLTTVWGTSPQNVYLTGWTSGGALMKRYDGAKWNSVILPRPQGLAAFFEFSQLLGFSSRDIYAIGAEYFYNTNSPPAFIDSSLILHFDGNSWRQIVLPQREGYLSRIWGDSPYNVYIASGKALWHFDGVVWTKDTISITLPSKGVLGVNALTGNSAGEIYMTLLREEADIGKSTYYFLKEKQDVWLVLDSAVIGPGIVESKWGYADLWTSPSGKLYSSQYGLYVWNGAWSQLYSTDRPLVRILGMSDWDIFAVGVLGTVLNFNGRDWFQYRQFEAADVIYTGIWTDGKEVFIAGRTYDGSKSIILHGK
jgi:hypothetical protein